MALFPLSLTALADDPLRESASLAVSSLDRIKHITEAAPDCDQQERPKAQQWAKKNIQQLELIPESKRGSLYYLIETFQCRLDNWREYKPFYDKLFAREDIQKAYPDALPQDQVENGMFFRVLGPGQKITEDTPIAKLAGKTVNDVFGYPGDMRLVDTLPALASRQLFIVQPDYFSHKHTGRYNTAYHEFGHVLHLSLMTPNEYKRIEELYLIRKKEGKFLDDYSGESSSEYLAQGLEAYLSETKPPLGLKSELHTRAQLKEKDPELYELISSIVESSCET